MVFSGDCKVEDVKARDEWIWGQIIMRNRDLKEILVQVDVFLVKRQVRFLILCEMTQLQCFPNPIRYVVPLMCHPRITSRLFSSSSSTWPCLIHHSNIIAEHKVRSSLSISLYHAHQLTLSTAYAEHSIHYVQYSPITAFTKYNLHGIYYLTLIVCLPFILMNTR